MSLIKRNDPCPCGSGKKYKKCCFLDEDKNNEIKRALQLSRDPQEIKTIISEKQKTLILKVDLLRIRYIEMEEEVSCIIEICGKQSLYSLHMLIQRAFDWDNDHMFSFYLGYDMRDRENEYSANPYGEHIVSGFGIPTKSASDTQLRDLDLKPDQEFLYLFDYGDELLHKIVVQSIEESEDQKSIQGRILSKTGKAPEQYKFEE